MKNVFGVKWLLHLLQIIITCIKSSNGWTVQPSIFGVTFGTRQLGHEIRTPSDTKPLTKWSYSHPLKVVVTVSDLKVTKYEETNPYSHSVFVQDYHKHTLFSLLPPRFRVLRLLELETTYSDHYHHRQLCPFSLGSPLTERGPRTYFITYHNWVYYKLVRRLLLSRVCVEDPRKRTGTTDKFSPLWDLVTIRFTRRNNVDPRTFFTF